MHRYLVVANQTVCGDAVAGKISELMAAGPCHFHVVVPATHSHQHMTWNEGEAVAIAHKHLDEALIKLRAIGADVDGEVGDGRPFDAVGDAIRREPPFDGIVLSTLPPGISRWLAADLPHRLEKHYRIPVMLLIGKAYAAA